MSEVISRPLQRRFLDIPQAPVCYWLRERFFEALRSPLRLESIAQVRQGLATTDNSRFTRCFWEVSHLATIGDGHAAVRWVKYAKGGRYQKWCGLEWLVVDWRHDGAAIKQQVLRGPGTTHWSRRVANYDYYFRAGLTYTQMCRGSMGTRSLAESIFDVKGMSIFLDDLVCSLDSLSAFLSTHVVSYLLRVVTQNLEFHAGYVAAMPIPKMGLPDLRELGEACRRLKRRLISSELGEHEFDPGRVYADHFAWQEQASILSIEGYCETRVCAAYDLDGEDIGAVVEETGAPVAWSPLVAGLDLPPCLPHQSATLPLDVASFLESQRRISLDETEIANLRGSLRSLFESGPGKVTDDHNNEPEDEHGDDDEPVLGATSPIPTEMFLEELSQKLRIHPVSICWLLKEGIENGGWRCIPEERRQWSDRITVAVLQLLGHRWPKQVAAGEPIPDWADSDGIIPITPRVNHSTIFQRVEERIATENGDAAEFAAVMDTTLNAWLAIEFFKHHTKQFKKRPIAWQLQSGKFTARKSPAFACLVYYHKLDADALPKIRSQYVGPLRQRLETELRGIEAVAAEARSERQAQRAADLQEWIAELEGFDDTLRDVTDSGFGPTPLRPVLRQFAIDDAMLALKSRWLSRLSEAIAGSILPEWLAAAERANLHADLPAWIAEALTHLNHHCAAVGAKPPKESALTTDPTSPDLAAIIGRDTNDMVSESLRLACDVWWQAFNDTVLKPLRERIGALKEEQTSIGEQVKDPSPEHGTPRRAFPTEDCAATLSTGPTALGELKGRQKEIKAEIKRLDREAKEKSARATELRRMIEAWRCDEAATWQGWLATQPLFDEVASIDGRKPPPVTIAEFIAQESAYAPDINDGVRVNIAPLQKAGLLAADVLAAKDVDKAIADRAEWRADERRWVREGKLPRPGWWPGNDNG